MTMRMTLADKNGGSGPDVDVDDDDAVPSDGASGPDVDGVSGPDDGDDGIERRFIRG